jgi:hypothetical protein
MVTITRSLARLLRAILRKAGLGKADSQADAFVHIASDSHGLRLRVAGPDIGIEYRQHGAFPTTNFVLPVEVLATIEGRTQEPVVLEPAEPGRIAISFSERGVPQLLDRNIDRTLKQPTWPELPATYTENSAELWPALRDAVATSRPVPAKSSARRVLPSKSAKTSLPLDQAIELRDSLRNAASAERIRERRAARGLTQEQLGEKCDLHRTFIGSVAARTDLGDQHILVEHQRRIAAREEFLGLELI